MALCIHVDWKLNGNNPWNQRISSKMNDNQVKEEDNNRLAMFVVQAPGKVEDKRAFHRACGGRQVLYSTYVNPRDRLQFRFRPEDLNSIALLSERTACSDLCVKVTKTRKADGSGFDYKFQTIGTIDTCFHFKNTICDMQLLPDEEGSNIRDEIMRPNFFVDFDPAKLATDQSSTIIKHFFFSRFINQRDNFLNLDDNLERQAAGSGSTGNAAGGIISHHRKTRKIVAKFITWNDPIPSQPPESLAELMKTEHELIEKIGDKFKERPIWSRGALQVLLKCPMGILKRLLPIHAYFFTTGPFRFLWAKYCFDPKLDPSSKPYQAIDIRIRWVGGELSQAMVKNYKVPIFKSTATPQPQLPSMESFEHEGGGGGGDDEETDERAHIFEPGRETILSKNIYQLCDVHMDEVQRIVHANDGSEEECSERDGWCAPGTIDQIRKLMVAETTKLLQQKSADGVGGSGGGEIVVVDQSMAKEEELEITQVDWNVADWM